MQRYVTVRLIIPSDSEDDAIGQATRFLATGRFDYYVEDAGEADADDELRP